MRLLDTKTLSLVEFHDNEIPVYAILSHRWQNEEVSFKDMCDGDQQSREGYFKIKSCCKLARKRGMSYVWVDTCCIDKSSSAELTESINSMYRWYANSHECYAYLSDVLTPRLVTAEHDEMFASSAWFSRGWTLQELIAPREVIFYNSHWIHLGTKFDLLSKISTITSIDYDVLTGSTPPSNCSVAQRMSWASRRVTTRAEDLAYCLLGIFEVNMPLLYGEGDRAFFRLQRKIIKQLDDRTIFAWTDSQEQKPVFARSPASFHGLRHLVCIYSPKDLREGHTLANSGLSIQVTLIPFSMNRFLVPLSCGYEERDEGVVSDSFRRSKRVCIVLQQTRTTNHFVRISHDGEDIMIKHADEIASIRNYFKIKPRRVFIQQQLTEVVGPLFDGFKFSFSRPGLFRDSDIPSAADVVCSNFWSEELPVFQLTHGLYRAAGVFRLSGLSDHNKVFFMHLGFDWDFAPIGVIRSVNRLSQDTETHSETDFGLLDKDSLDHLLDLRWLRKAVESQKSSDETILTFRANRQGSTEVVCKKLSLKLFFWVQDSHKLQSSVWHVAFEPIQNDCHPVSDPDEEESVNGAE